jgi:hypothetical protein
VLETTTAHGGLRPARLLADATGNCDQPTTGIPSPRQILRAKLFGISVCLGTASTAPVAGFIQSEWERPSRLSTQP